jgi:sec-independent protein translocase protein TatA
MSGISIWQLMIVFVILLLLFGSKKIRHIGSDLGHSIKSFRKSIKEEDESVATAPVTAESIENK